MTTADSTRKKASTARRKPTKDFPLFPHRNGQWAKKILGRLVYFGTDRDKAIDLWLKQKDDLLAGRTPRDYDTDALTVEGLCNLFLERKESDVESGELSQRSWDDYKAACVELASNLGKTTPVEALHPDDFKAMRRKLSKGVGLKTLDGRVTRVRAVFNYGSDNGFISVNLARLWGTEFEKPTKAAMEREVGNRESLFSADQIKAILAECKNPQMRAMLLLGINSGIGNTDVASIEFDDIEGSWLIKKRKKTGKRRRIPLWKETVEAINKAIEKRPKHKSEEDAKLVFITKYGSNWIPVKGDDSVSKEFAKLRKAAGLKIGTFYWLRHTFQTIGDETKDFVAVSQIMGHVDNSIQGRYRERISDERLQAVTDHVRQWLFGSEVAS